METDEQQPEVEEDAIRQRAFELSQEHPEATAEENWLSAEQEIVAQLMTTAQMAVYGHS
jgi:hypothetical protein